MLGISDKRVTWFCLQHDASGATGLIRVSGPMQLGCGSVKQNHTSIQLLRTRQKCQDTHLCATVWLLSGPPLPGHPALPFSTLLQWFINDASSSFLFTFFYSSCTVISFLSSTFFLVVRGPLPWSPPRGMACKLEGVTRDTNNVCLCDDSCGIISYIAFFFFWYDSSARFSFSLRRRQHIWCLKEQNTLYVSERGRGKCRSRVFIYCIPAETYRVTDDVYDGEGWK